MSVAKVTEITATSPKSFDAALRAGVQRANKTLKNVAYISSSRVGIAHPTMNSRFKHKESC